jgi:hypothetical protein
METGGAGGINKVLRSWWLQKTQEFKPGRTFNEGTRGVCVCVCVSVYSVVTGKEKEFVVC